MTEKTLEIHFQELREQIAQEIEVAAVEMREDAQGVSSDAALIAHRVSMICAAIARGKE
jgi:hypothetical protein